MPSDKEVMFSSAPVCLFVGGISPKYLFNRFPQNLVDSWQRKKPLDFGGNPAHVTAG